ncbi:hypothetical protein NC651_038284 [Populus alba x Populus x berolinensis]|nr:hypothetical protein NC651_038284 [Populus alba x Populus x berolinensis]
MRRFLFWGEGGLVICRWGGLGLGRRRRNEGGECQQSGHIFTFVDGITDGFIPSVNTSAKPSVLIPSVIPSAKSPAKTLAPSTRPFFINSEFSVGNYRRKFSVGDFDRKIPTEKIPSPPITSSSSSAPAVQAPSPAAAPLFSSAAAPLSSSASVLPWPQPIAGRYAFFNPHNTPLMQFLNKACVIKNPEEDLMPDGGASDPWCLCIVDQVEELKALIKKIRIGILGSAASMAVLAIIERVRGEIAIREGILDIPDAVTHMSAMWLLPFYFLLGFSEAMNGVGLNEFFYTELPKNTSSVASNLYSIGVSAASLVASFIVCNVRGFISEANQESWVSSNINKGHYDYYYWLLDYSDRYMSNYNDYIIL